MPITNGRNFETYELDVGAEETIETPMGALRVLPIKRAQRANLLKKTIREGGVRKTVWLSANALRTLSRGPYRGIELL